MKGRCRRLAAVLVVVACRDGTGPRQPRTAITFVRSGPRALVVSSPDGMETYATYPLPFAPNDAALSPDHMHIVISNDVLGELWVQTTAGGQSRMIVGPDSGAAMPSWSPDGKHILFYRSTNGGAWMIDPDGSNEHPIGSQPPAFAPQFDPAWSPDGTLIAFDDDYNGAPTPTLYVMNPDGTGAHAVPLPAGDTHGDAWEPAWSPDGGQLAFGRGTDSSTVLWIANVDGSSARALVSANEIPGSPSWSPNGDEIAFASFSASPVDLAVVNIRSGAVRHLRSATSVAAEYSPHWIVWP